MSSHNLAGVPKLASSRNAVSGLMPRRSATISCMRCGGTRSFSAKAFADRPRASSSSFKIAPGWYLFECELGHLMSLVVINNLNIFGVTVFETKNEPPRAVDRHRPLALPSPDKRMKANRFKRRNVIQRTCGVQHLHPCERFCDVHAFELRFAILSKTLRRSVGKAFNHKAFNNTSSVTWQPCYVQG
jgi:hypothetical protein